jgi:putative ABC transport system permease protein
VRDSTRFGIYVPFVGRIADEVRPMIFHLRTANNPIGLAPALRQLVSELEPQARITGLWTMNEFIDSNLSRERVLTQFSGFFSGFALLLASLGLYGLLSYGVARRTREIGVRVALGAQVRDVVALVLRQGLGLVLIGSVVGVAVALTGAQLVASLLFGVSAADPFTLAGTTVTMLVIALLACWLPARRAARVDPMVALRVE